MRDFFVMFLALVFNKYFNKMGIDFRHESW